MEADTGRLHQMGIVATEDGGVLIAGSVCHDSTFLDLVHSD